MKKLTYLSLTTCFFVYSSLNFGNIFAQGKTQTVVKNPVKNQPVVKIDEKGAKVPDKKPGDGMKKEKDDTGKSPSSSSQIALDLGVAGGIGIPLGALSAVGLGMGGGGHLDVIFKLPITLGPVELKVGLSAGFYGLGLQSASQSQIKASFSLIPLLGYAIFALPIKSIGLTPYLGLGGGGAMANANITGASTTALSSFDGALAFRAGAAYSLPSLPKLSLLLNLGYLMIFEQNLAGNPNNGSLFNVELGVSYRILGN